MRNLTTTALRRQHVWVREMQTLPGIFLWMETLNELNAHEHFRYRQKRARVQHDAVAKAMLAAGIPHTPPPLKGTAVLLIRYSPGSLDPHDGLPAAFKHVVDALCKWWGINDGPGCPVAWNYNQFQSPRGCCGVRIVLGTMQPCGHFVSAIVSSDEGTNYCGECAREASEGKE